MPGAQTMLGLLLTLRHQHLLRSHRLKLLRQRAHTSPRLPQLQHLYRLCKQQVSMLVGVIPSQPPHLRLLSLLRRLRVMQGVGTYSRMTSLEVGVTRALWRLPVGRSRAVLVEMPMICLGMFGSKWAVPKLMKTGGSDDSTYSLWRMRLLHARAYSMRMPLSNGLQSHHAMRDASVPFPGQP